MTPPPIAVHDLGGAGPTVLYAHATGFHGHVWQPIADLLPHLHHIAYDARGHGETPTGDGWEVHWSDYGGDAEAIARRFADNGPVIGVGHSMGAAALLMAALATPDSFRGLVLYEAIVMSRDLVPSAPPGNYMAAAARKRRSTFPSFEAAIANFASKPPLNILTPEALELYVLHGFQFGEDGQVHLRCRPEHEARTYEESWSHGTWERLHDIAVPVWVVNGRPEEGQPSARQRDLADQIPDSRYIELDHLSHFGPMEAPADIAVIIAEAAATF